MCSVVKVSPFVRVSANDNLMACADLALYKPLAGLIESGAARLAFAGSVTILIKHY